MSSKDTIADSLVNVYKDIPPNPPPFDDYGAEGAIFDHYQHEEDAEVEPPSSLTSAQIESETKAPLFIWADDLGSIPPVEYFDLPGTHHNLPKKKLTFMYGESASCKSFLALDYALKIGQSSPVLYVAGEGIEGYNNRVGAWRAANGGYTRNIAFWNTVEHNTPQLFDPAQVQNVLDVTKAIEERTGQPIALIVIDTLARVIVGQEENSNTDMGVLIDTCEHLIRETGAAVLVVHHTGKDGKTMRGAYTMFGAVQSSLAVVRNAKENLITVSCDKSKDTGDDNPANGTNKRYYNLMSAADSVVLVPLSRIIENKDEITPRERDMLEALSGQSEPIQKKAWWEECSTDHRPTNKVGKMEGGNMRTYIKKLMFKGMVEEQGEGNDTSYTITEKGRGAIGVRLVKSGKGVA